MASQYAAGEDLTAAATGSGEAETTEAPAEEQAPASEQAPDQQENTENAEGSQG